MLLMVTTLGGCGGCRRDDQLSKEELEKRAREQKEALEALSLITLPADGQTQLATVKGGHWFESQQKFKSNREDAQVVVAGDLVRNNQVIGIPGTNMFNEFSRKTSLPKGQTKTVDLQYFIPYSGSKSDDPFAPPQKLGLRTQLRSWPLMTPLLASPIQTPGNELKNHEFQLSVLSPHAASYEYLSILDAVYWRGDDLSEEPRTRSYQVSLVKPEEGKYAFPRSLLTMTAIAVVVWDDVSLDEFSVDQQEALVDWLHWGGQLIVNGPSSWSRLQNSFLSKYLPATSADAAEFTTSDFAELSDTWTVPDLNRPPSTLRIEGAPIGGLRFKLNEAGRWLPHSGELVAERQVGRGRLIVTAFQLREPRIFNWRCFSNFLSTGLLRRPPRRVSVKDSLQIQNWANAALADTDPRLHSNLRILGRDMWTSNDTTSEQSQAGGDLGLNAIKPIQATASRLVPANLESLRWGKETAAWNDYSGMSQQAVKALRRAAGIEFPDRWTIVYLIGGYLIVLVPVNWLIFRILGRLEFAWVAAPILAIAAVIVVTRVARLDIGFARRTTEISVLELYGGHSRGHLSRFIALYTSLSTNYSIEFPESGSVVLPIGSIDSKRRRDESRARNLRTNFGISSGVVLEPFLVYSNSTEMLHAEQMISLAGEITLERSEGDQLRLMNASEIELQDALLLRNVAGTIEFARLDQLTPKTAKSVEFRVATSESLWEGWNSNSETIVPDDSSGETPAGVDRLWIGGILSEIARKTPLMDGQTRLIGRTEQRLGDLKINPIEEQFDGRCVVVVHLEPAKLSPVYPDENIASPTNNPTTIISGGEQE